MTNLNSVALLMRDDIVTVHCAFNSEDDKEYTYVCEKHIAFDLCLGDSVIVRGNKKRLQVVEVRQIDEDCDVELDSSWDYAWVVQRVNVEAYERNQAETARTVKTLKQRKRASVRRQALESLGITDVEQLTSGFPPSIGEI